MAICSGALREEIELALRVVGLADRFPVIVAARDVRRGKPDPEGYRRARALLSDAVGRELKAERCVVCEDSPAGIAAGHAAGMKVCALTTSFPPEQVAEADLVVADLSGVALADLASLV